MNATEIARTLDLLAQDGCSIDVIDGAIEITGPTADLWAEKIGPHEELVRRYLEGAALDESEIPPEEPEAVAVLDRLLDRLRKGEGDKLFPAGEALKGLEVGPGLITIIGAPPAAGKTALTMQLVVEALTADDHLRVVIANAEMDFEVLLRRELTRLSGVPGRALRFADLRPHQLQAVETAAASLRQLLARITVMRSPFTAEGLRKTCEGLTPGLLVIDCLQKFATATEIRQEVNYVITQLRLLAMHGWGVLALSATTRGHGKNGSSHDPKNLTMASFKEIGEIEFNADAAYLLKDLVLQR